MPKRKRDNPPDNAGRRIFVEQYADPTYPWSKVLNTVIKTKCMLCRRYIFPREEYWKRGLRQGVKIKGLPEVGMFRWVHVCPTCYEAKCQ